MNVYHAKELEDPNIVRAHPWDYAESDDSHRYYDFKANPDLIPDVLEDYRPWAKYPAIKNFYGLLSYINGPACEFESNDCAFWGPQDNTNSNFQKSLQCSGRLMILYRDLTLNSNPKYMQTLNEGVRFYLERLDTDLKFAFVGTSFLKVNYWKLPPRLQMGQQLALNFWAWGDDDKETFDNLGRIFLVLQTCLDNLSRNLRNA